MAEIRAVSRHIQRGNFVSQTTRFACVRYKLSALSQRAHRTHPNGEWQNLDTSKVATGTGSIGTGGSEEAIVPGHIMMKTDISLKTERV